MINKVNNLNEKSFKNYSGPDKEFKQKTLYLDIMEEENPHLQKE